MHSNNTKFSEFLTERLTALAADKSNLPTVIEIDRAPDFTQDDVLSLTDYLPRVEATENWWTKLLTPRVIGGNYQRKREVFSTF